MTEVTGQCLIHLSTSLVGGVVGAQSMISRVQTVGEIVAISSVYKRYLSSARVDLNSNLEAVLCLHTKCAVDELLWHFKEYSVGKREKLQLLAYDELVVLSPQLTLPNPSLHADALIVRCAAEVWPEYEHPIMQKTLREIAAKSPPAVDAEFYLQGKSLVDF